MPYLLSFAYSLIGVEAMKGDQTVAELAGRYQVHASQVQAWKKALLVLLC